MLVMTIELTLLHHVKVAEAGQCHNMVMSLQTQQTKHGKARAHTVFVTALIAS